MSTRPVADLMRRLNVVELGQSDGQPMVFIHGYATNQEVWRHVTPAFESRYRVIVYDHVGAGRSDRSAWDTERYGSLYGYVDDLAELVERLDLADVILVGHSIGGMIGALAIGQRPDRYERLVMVAPSARFLDDDGYVGGFSRAQIDELLVALEADYPGWARTMAPHLVGSASAAVAEELTGLMLGGEPPEARDMAKAFLLADHRAELAAVPVPTLVMESPDDPFVPGAVTDYVERHLPNGHLVQLKTSGHFPILSSPSEVNAAISAFISG